MVSPNHLSINIVLKDDLFASDDALSNMGVAFKSGKLQKKQAEAKVIYKTFQVIICLSRPNHHSKKSGKQNKPINEPAFEIE